MSTTVLADATKPYYLLVNGNDQYYLNQLASPPFAFLNKSVLYSQTDGVLYYNGSPVQTGPVNPNTVTSSTVNSDGSIAIWDGTGTKAIKNSNANVLSDGTIGPNAIAFKLNTTSPYPGVPSLLWLKGPSEELVFNKLVMTGQRTPCMGSMQYEELIIGTTFITTLSVPFQIQVATTVNSNPYFASTGLGSIQYTGQNAFIAFNCSVLVSEAAAPDRYFMFWIQRNGVKQANTTAQCLVSTNNFSTISWSGVLNVLTNDVITVWAMNLTSNASFRVKGMSLVLTAPNL